MRKNIFLLVIAFLIVMTHFPPAFAITPVWDYKTGGEIFSSPVISDIDGNGKPEIIFGSNDNHLYVLDVVTKNVIWDYKAGDKIISSPATADINGDGRVEILFTSLDNNLYVLKGASGELLWKFDGGNWLSASPLVCDVEGDGLLEVFISSHSGKVYLLDGKSGEVKWTFSAGEPFTASSSAADINGDGIAEIVTGSWDNKVYCFKGDTGELLWDFSALDDICASPVMGDINNDGEIEVIACSYDKSVYALNGATGELIWKYDTGDVIDASPVMGDINNDGIVEVLVSSYDNSVHVLNGENGRLIWKQVMENWISASPLIADMDGDGIYEVFLLSWDGKLYIYNGSNGILKESLSLSGRLLATPALFESDIKTFLALASDEGKLYLLSFDGKFDILWGKFQGDSWNTGFFENTISYGKILGSGKMTSWGPEGYEMAQVSRARFDCSYKIDDNALGNGNGKFEAGETVALNIIVTNPTQEAGSQVKLKIISSEPKITFTPSEVVIGSFNPGEEKFLELALKADENTVLDSVDFTVNIEGENCENYSQEFQVALTFLEGDSPPSISLSKPLDLSGETILETNDSRMTIEGIAKAETGLGGFEVSCYVGKLNDNLDWTEKGPQAKGKTEYFFSQDIELKAGLNNISIRAVDMTGREVTEEFSIIYTPKEGKRWAVVIGIGQYENEGVRDLDYSAQDARNIYEYLTSYCGFSKENTILLTDKEATLKEVKTALGTFLRQKAGKEDLVFIYYSGHGAPEIDNKSADGDGLSKYIVTYDADPDNLYATALPMDEISRIFSRISAERIVFFIDSCYSGSAGGKTFFADADIGKAENISQNFLKELSSGTGRIVITASNANEVALESDELGHGIFTHFLLEALRGNADRDGNGFVTVDEVYQYLYDEVARESDNRQHPVKMSQGKVEGDIILGKPVK